MQHERQPILFEQVLIFGGGVADEGIGEVGGGGGGVAQLGGGSFERGERQVRDVGVGAVRAVWRDGNSEEIEGARGNSRGGGVERVCAESEIGD